MNLDERITRLIAIGASITANCQPCLQINIAKARECGADEHEIAQAIKVGRLVRSGAASKMDEFAASLSDAVHVPAGAADCGCGS